MNTMHVEAHLIHYRIVIELLVGVVGLAFSGWSIFGDMQNTIAWDVDITTGWVLALAGTLIIPAVSLWLIYKNGKRLWENLKLTVSQTGLEVRKRTGNAQWTWNDIQTLRYGWRSSWYWWGLTLELKVVFNEGNSIMIDNRFHNAESVMHLISRFRS